MLGWEEKITYEGVPLKVHVFVNFPDLGRQYSKGALLTGNEEHNKAVTETLKHSLGQLLEQMAYENCQR